MLDRDLVDWPTCLKTLYFFFRFLDFDGQYWIGKNASGPLHPGADLLKTFFFVTSVASGRIFSRV